MYASGFEEPAYAGMKLLAPDSELEVCIAVLCSMCQGSALEGPDCIALAELTQLLAPNSQRKVCIGVQRGTLQVCIRVKRLKGPRPTSRLHIAAGTRLCIRA